MASLSLEKITQEDTEHCNELHVVGIGASAGGLEAIESLLKDLPSDTGMAFVIVQHLSPDFKSHMDDLVRRRTDMKVQLVSDGVTVEPNNVYLIPARKEMVISGRKLLLTDKSNGTLSHPIDQFLRSLATDLGRYSVGIILSGTGSDGARGIREISEAGGLTIVQDPSTAKFDGMPRSAEATGYVDLVLSPEAIPGALVKYVREGLDSQVIAAEEIIPSQQDELDKIFSLLNKQHGIDFAHYKSSTIARRIQRRIQLHRLSSIEEYLAFAESQNSEVNDLYQDLLIGVTSFMRDEAAFETLRENVIPQLVTRAEESRRLRAWVAGCATGEEAYSLAILLDEEIQRRNSNVEVKIFATDAHHESLHAAARGVYSSELLSDLGEERRSTYFEEHRDGYHVIRRLRRMIVFAPHNIINDAPFTQMDLVSCRNLLIYLQPSAQKKTLSLFHFALKANGFLFLGPSESTSDLSDEFETIDKKWRVFRKKRDIRLPIESRLPIGGIPDSLISSTVRTKADNNRVDAAQIAIYDRLLDRRMPPSVLVDENYEIKHIFGGFERYLTLKPGRPTNNVLDMIHPSLRTSAAGALQHAVHRQEMVRYTGLNVIIEEHLESIELSVDYILDPQHNVANLLLEVKAIVKDESSGSSTDVEVDVEKLSQARITSLESDLRYAQENLQATIEEMETSNEELQATNEELVASNEEWQSTNEELHSVNEELFTVNAEYQRRVDELAQANDDMDNLLATTRVGVIFLDTKLCIRRYTPEIARLLHLSSQDIGRSISGFSHHLSRESLVEDLQSVLGNEQELELELTDRSGSPFLLRVMPYRSGDNVDGVVLTLIDIRALKKTEDELRRFEFMAEAAVDCILLLETEGSIVYANPATTTLLDYTAQELQEISILELIATTHSNEFAENLAKENLKSFECSFKTKAGDAIDVEIASNHLKIGANSFVCIHVRDIRERKRLTAAQQELLALFDASPDAIFVWDQDDGIIKWNDGSEQLYGYSEQDALGVLPGKLLKTEFSDPIEVVKERIQKKGSWSGVIKHTRKDGRELTISSTHQGILRPDGVQRILQVNRDITKEYDNQLKLERAMNMARRANKAKSEFLANMSHELRTPMTAMLGFADILRMESTDPEFLEKVDTIKRNGQYLLTLLNDILDLSKIESGKLQFEQEPVDIVKLIDDIQDLMKVRSASTGIPLKYEYASPIPEMIQGDHIRLRQILVNLIGNGLKFTDQGEVRVVIGVDRANKYVGENSAAALYFDVIDTGIGMTEEQVKQLFQPFAQVSEESHRKTDGTGLGLSISKRLAQKMKGILTVASEPNKGSTFRLSLPLNEDHLKALITPSSTPKTNGESTDSTESKFPEISGKVLLADDRRDVWRIAKYFLEKCGAEVTIAENGQEALQSALDARDAGNPFDIILMDMQMPVMSGKDAVIALREQGFITPIIALTADAMDGRREDCLEAGCNEYVTKPIDAPYLARLVKKLISV